jgi:REP element-mobilizing transposase RayT
MPLRGSLLPSHNDATTMTRTRYNFLTDDANPCFITLTVVNWLPLFSNPVIVAILLDSLRFLILEKRINLIAYVIMENHAHMVLSAEDIEKEVASLKSFTARKCIDDYIEQKNRFVLDQLAELKHPDRKDRDYQFWQEGSHPQRIVDERMLEQKIEYIHYNPVRRGYVELPEHWRYSSTIDYCGGKGLVPVAWLD